MSGPVAPPGQDLGKAQFSRGIEPDVSARTEVSGTIPATGPGNGRVRMFENNCAPGAGIFGDGRLRPPSWRGFHGSSAPTGQVPAKPHRPAADGHARCLE